MLKTGKKLSFLSAGRPWKSALPKTLLFGLGLFGVYFLDFSIAAFLLFLILAAGIYFSQLAGRGLFRLSFLISVVAAVSALLFWADNFYLVIINCLIFSFLFYLLLGLPGLIFKNRQRVYLFFNTGLLLLIFVLLFGIDKIRHFLAVNILIFLAVFLLLEECFRFLQSTSQESAFIIRNPRFLSLLFAFLALELFWAIGLLPIGFINSAILLAVFVLMLRDFSLAYFGGRLNRHFTANHFLAFAILVFFVLAISKWRIQ